MSQFQRFEAHFSYVFEVLIQQCVVLSLCLSPSACNLCRTQCGEMLFEGAYFHAQYMDFFLIGMQTQCHPKHYFVESLYSTSMKMIVFHRNEFNTFFKKEIGLACSRACHLQTLIQVFVQACICIEHVYSNMHLLLKGFHHNYIGM